jgi:hypothetical protein
MNLRMLVIAGGRERTLDDYRALAAVAGLATLEVTTTPSGVVVNDCIPAGFT